VFFPDMKHLLEIVLQIVYYITPIMYPAEILSAGDRGLGWLADYNPVTSLMALIREPILYARCPSLSVYGVSLAIVCVVAGLATPGGVRWAPVLVTSLEAVAFAVIMIFYAPRLVRRMEPGLERMSTPDAPLVIALAICLGLSYAAVKIGMAAIIGAFFAGLAFAEYSPRWNLRPRVLAINEFLAPFFFFSMGARLNTTVFDGHLLVSAAVISILAFLSKLLGCGLPVLRFGWRTAAKVGIGMVPRGEVGLIVALVGLQHNIISPSAYALVIFMTGATTLVAPPLLKMLFRDDGAAQPAPAAEEQSSAM